MKRMPLQKTISTALLLILFSTTSALAAATVSVTSSGDTSYSVQGTGMDGVAGIQLDFNYDASSLSSPAVTKGGLVSGAMLAANTTRPGSIRVAIISTTAFSGSGQIANVTFAGRTGTGGITSASVNMIDTKGAKITASITVSGTSSSGIPGLSNTPGVPFSQPGETTPTVQQSQTSAGAQSGSSATATSLGSVTMPTDQQQLGNTPLQQAPSPAVPVEPVEPAATRTAEQAQPTAQPAAEVKPEETPQYVVYKGVLDRFRLYDGSKKLPAVAELFDKKIAQTIMQSPAIVISNGLDKAILTIDIPARIKSAPNFAVKGGTIVSYKQDKELKGRWLVEVAPETGSLLVSVTIIAGAEEFEFPLTVAPPVKTALTFDEKGWDIFVATTGTAKAPLHDLNGDGIRNYVDDYIFVANILAKKSTPVNTAPATLVPAKPIPAAAPKTGK